MIIFILHSDEIHILCSLCPGEVLVYMQYIKTVNVGLILIQIPYKIEYNTKLLLG